MNNETDKRNYEMLIKAFLKLRDTKEADNFLQDLLSTSEIQSIAARLYVARQLFNGASYVDIERETGISSATIAKVSESLKYGKDGYRVILERLKRAK